jgi:hypothetical protein
VTASANRWRPYGTLAPATRTRKVRLASHGDEAAVGWSAEGPCGLAVALLLALLLLLLLLLLRRADWLTASRIFSALFNASGRWYGHAAAALLPSNVRPSTNHHAKTPAAVGAAAGAALTSSAQPPREPSGEPSVEPSAPPSTHCHGGAKGSSVSSKFKSWAK